MIGNIIKNLKKDGLAYLKVRITPKSSENKIMEIMEDETVKIRITAAPEKGKANKELIKFLEKELKKEGACEHPKVTIINGKTDRNKLIKITL